MLKNFFRHTDILPKNVNILDGNAEDLDNECAEYEKKITQAGGIELFVASKQQHVEQTLNNFPKYQILFSFTIKTDK